MKLTQINKSYIIRSLACFSFIIFFCPFLQTCSNREIKNSPKYRALESEIKKTQFLTESQDNNTINVYLLAYFSIVDIDFNAFLEIDFYFFLLIDFIIISSIIILYFSFKNRFYKIKKYAIISVLMLFTFTSYLIYDSTIKEISQIKYGYYLFLINLILIIYFSNQLIKEEKN